MNYIVQLISPIMMTLIIIIQLSPILAAELSANPVDVITEGVCGKREKVNSFKGTVTHEPAVKGECLTCHNLHNSDNDKLLQSTVGEVCMSCHETAVAELPPLAIFEDKQMNQHQPFKEGNCQCCHQPHASDHPNLLHSDYPQTAYANYSSDTNLCLNCHSKATFEQPRTLTETKFRDGNLNLHYRHVNKKKGRSCRVCHHHHGAIFPAIIRQESGFGKKKIVISQFEKTDTGGLCASSCHQVIKYDRLEPVFNGLKVSPREGIDATDEELYQLLLEQLKKESSAKSIKESTSR